MDIQCTGEKFFSNIRRHSEIDSALAFSFYMFNIDVSPRQLSHGPGRRVHINSNDLLPRAIADSFFISYAMYAPLILFSM
jgi:hypothetical protein